ncbi:MAG: ABC transporter permease, partial [Bacteroidales bacterium]
LKTVKEIYPKEKGKEHSFFANANVVTNDFLKVYKIPLIGGHGFTGSQDSEKKVMVNQAFVKAMHWKDSILGRTFSDEEGEYEIVGLVKNYNFESLRSKISPLVFYYTDRPHSFSVRISLQSNYFEDQKIINTIKKTLVDFDSFYIPSISFINHKIQSLYNEDQQKVIMVFAAAILTIVISIMGLFALTSFTMQRKRKEIAIRRVLGASVPTTIFYQLFSLLKWVLLANILAYPLAYFFMEKWLSNFVYRINLSMEIFFMASALTLSIAIMTIVFHVIRIVYSQPIDAIKAEV